MTYTILEFVNSFVNSRLSADDFANAYLELWRIEREREVWKHKEYDLGGVLASIFCVADLYNPDDDKEDYEFNDDQLKHKVIELLKEHDLKIKQQNVIKAIESHADIINFGSTSDAVDDHWITKSEDYLGVKLPESYLWFLKNYSGGEIAGEEIYSIYGMEFENINGGDIVFQHITNKRNNLIEEKRIVISETDLGEVFFFNYEEFDGIEAQIFIKLPSGNVKLYADDFYEFLIMRINLLSATE